jgi:hypothetical protein
VISKRIVKKQAIPGLQVLKRINTLIKDIAGNGNDGIGKPEPLKHGVHGCWSRAPKTCRYLRDLAKRGLGHLRVLNNPAYLMVTCRRF